MVVLRHGLEVSSAVAQSKSPASILTADSSGRFVAYLRVSTEGQGRSGLGLEAQRQAVADHIAYTGGELISEFQEVESGRKNNRPTLAAALASCRTRRAVLLVAKLDRLARDARFLLELVEGTGEAGVVFCDLPQLPPGPVGKFMLTQMAAVAELEAGLTGQRTRAALAAAKARGIKLGNPRLQPGTGATAAAARAVKAERSRDKIAELKAVVETLRAERAISEGAGLDAIAAALMTHGVRAPRGGANWSATQVQRVLKVR